MNPFDELRAQHATELRAFYGVDPSAVTDVQVHAFVALRCSFGGIEFVARDIAAVRVPREDGSTPVRLFIEATASEKAIACLQDASGREVRAPLHVETIGTMRGRISSFGMGGGGITMEFDQDDTPNPRKAADPDSVERNARGEA